MTVPGRGLYAILDAGLVPPAARAEAARAAIAGGAVMLQYRDKTADARTRRRSADTLQTCAREAGIPLLINDDVTLAAAVGAAGVHLGQGDAGIAAARRHLGADAIVGVTCHDRLELARAADAAGADYLSFGRFFPSATKPGAPGADPAVLTAARAAFDRPIVAIGGVNADNGATLLAAGADLLAVAGAVFAAGDVRAAAGRITDLFRRYP
ncbi:thiamine-phosphate pyrophosphorylase [Salinisphaera sp. PC39]|uniref:thiamine phosphate synthase n=1 Tax=Salinisphaera sp. PC39 TaxID=1304156 RepID=UPI00333EF593